MPLTLPALGSITNTLASSRSGGPKRRILAAAVAAAILAASLVVFSQAAWAGRLHPEVEAQLRSLPPGGTLSVIIEMATQADTAAAARSAPRTQRLARKRAVVDALRNLANQHQVP